MRASHLEATEMAEERTKQADIVYIQRDLEAIKHTLDKVLRPYKSDVKTLRESNASLRASIARKEQDIEGLMRLIAKHRPDLVDVAITVLLDPSRRGWKSFRRSWRQRVGFDDAVSG